MTAAIRKAHMRNMSSDSLLVSSVDKQECVNTFRNLGSGKPMGEETFSVIDAESEINDT
jgi:hypothetical protein